MRGIYRIDDDRKEKKEKKTARFDGFGMTTGETVDKFIDIIWSWYHVKYPDSDLSVRNGIVSSDVNKNIVNNCEVMTLEKLCDRLSYEIMESLKCNYISEYHDNDTKIDNNYVYIPIFTVKKSFVTTDADKMCVIISDVTGKIIDINGDNLLPKTVLESYNTLYLEELLEIFRKHVDEETVNIEYLKKAILKRKNDFIIRDNIFEETCYRIFANSNGNLEYGFFRAQHFLNDFGHLYNIHFENTYLDHVLEKYRGALKSQEKKVKKKKFL